MATLKEIKRRITSVKSTQQITRAMKMVAAAKLRRTQNQLMQTRPYEDKLADILSYLSVRAALEKHPYFRKVKKTRRECYILVTGDRGLCGSFNSNLIRRAHEILDKRPGRRDLVVLGKKGHDHFRRRDANIVGHFTDFFNDLEIKHAKQIVHDVVEKFESKKYDKVYVIYNEFKSVIQQEIVVQQLLPLDADKLSREETKERIVSILVEPSVDTVLQDLIPMHLNFAMWRVLLESYTSELAARMTAMETASENAEDMIQGLTQTYNKVRQAAITTEISEIVGGAEALRG